MYYSPQILLLACLALSGALQSAVGVPIAQPHANAIARSFELEAEGEVPHLDKRLLGFGGKGKKPPKTVAPSKTVAPPKTTVVTPPKISVAASNPVTTSTPPILATSKIATSAVASSSAAVHSSSVPIVAFSVSSVVSASSLATSRSAVSSSKLASSSVVPGRSASITSSISSIPVASSSAVLNGTLTSAIAKASSSSTILNGTLTSSIANASSSSVALNATSTLSANATATSAAGAEPTVDPNGAACALKAPASAKSASKPVASAKKPTRRTSYKLDRHANATHLVPRAIEDFPNRLFLGYHGTQSLNAAEFEANGVRPQDLTSGANAELGLGLYVADELQQARGFANNAHNNVNKANGVKIPDGKAVLAKVCKIFAKDTNTWINTPKFWFPGTEPGTGAKLIADDVSDQAKRNLFEQNRRNFATKNGLAGAQLGNFVRFAPLDFRRNSAESQFSIPAGLQNQLVVKCFTVDPAHELGPGFQEDPELTSDPSFPRFSYRNQIGPWRITQGCT